jgi:hypothetical protein
MISETGVANIPSSDYSFQGYRATWAIDAKWLSLFALDIQEILREYIFIILHPDLLGTGFCCYYPQQWEEYLTSKSFQNLVDSGFSGFSFPWSISDFSTLWWSQSTHLLSFGFCHVASLHISRSFQFPDHIFAFLMGCASKFATQNSLLNFVPPLFEFIWLSDARIQIKWLWPTLSSHSFLDDLHSFIYYDSPTNQ